MSLNQPLSQTRTLHSLKEAAKSPPVFPQQQILPRSLVWWTPFKLIQVLSDISTKTITIIHRNTNTPELFAVDDPGYCAVSSIHISIGFDAVYTARSGRFSTAVTNSFLVRQPSFPFTKYHAPSNLLSSILEPIIKRTTALSSKPTSLIESTTRRTHYQCWWRFEIIKSLEAFPGYSMM